MNLIGEIGNALGVDLTVFSLSVARMADGIGNSILLNEDRSGGSLPVKLTVKPPNFQAYIRRGHPRPSLYCKQATRSDQMIGIVLS